MSLSAAGRIGRQMLGAAFEALLLSRCVGGDSPAFCHSQVSFVSALLQLLTIRSETLLLLFLFEHFCSAINLFLYTPKKFDYGSCNSENCTSHWLSYSALRAGAAMPAGSEAGGQKEDTCSPEQGRHALAAINMHVHSQEFLCLRIPIIKNINTHIKRAKLERVHQTLKVSSEYIRNTYSPAYEIYK